MTELTSQQIQELLPERYRLERELERGGMARVFLARESHPDRDVAIKVMDTQLSEEGRDRFLREVSFTSKLSHPHIVPIYAAGQLGELLYYVMPFVEGETLADRLEREGTLPVAEAVQITLDVARALQYAHGKGVTHRDIKPGNVLFQDDHALLADFGVARARDEPDPGVTRDGRTLGTVEYMAPEQATGSADVDGRADQYGLACMFYETVCGRPPFADDDPQRTLQRHLSEAPAPLRSHRRELGAAIEQVVLRALSKDPAERFASMGEFADALGGAFARTPERMKRPTTAGHRPVRAPSAPWLKLGVPAVVLLALALFFGPWSRDEPVADDGSGYLTSVAVLAPEGDVIGSDPAADPEALAIALANEISTVLSRVARLEVRQFYSVRAVQDGSLSVQQLLDTLDVEHLIGGILSVQGNRINIQMGPIDARERMEDGVHRTLTVDQWFEQQPGIAAAVAEDFVARFAEQDSIPFAELPIPGPGQRDFLRGNEFLGRRTPSGIRLAIDAYWTAIEKDADYAPAYAQLSSAYALALTYRYDIGIDEYRAAGLAEALATRAIELNPDGAAGYAARSYIRALAAAPTVNAAADIDRARRLEPNNPSVPSWSARVHSLQGNQEQALREALRAAQLDQLGSGRQFAVAYQALQMGLYETVVEFSDIALELEPELMLPRVTKARALVLLGRPGECLEMELGPHAGARALCLWEDGERERARAIIDSLEAAYGTGPVGDFTPVTVAEDLAVFYGYTGDAEAALRWIEEAYERSPTGMELRVLDSGAFDPVRDEPGFQFTVRRLRGELWDRAVSAWEGPLVRPEAES